MIKDFEELQGREKKKKKRGRKKHRDYEENDSGTFEEYSYEYSYEEKNEEKVVGGAGGLGLKVKKGQKLSQKQLQMLETAAEERKTSTNPLCKEKKQTNMFR